MLDEPLLHCHVHLNAWPAEAGESVHDAPANSDNAHHWFTAGPVSAYAADRFWHDQPAPAYPEWEQAAQEPGEVEP